jgi:hypothetical protein
MFQLVHAERALFPLAFSLQSSRGIAQWLRNRSTMDGLSAAVALPVCAPWQGKRQSAGQASWRRVRTRPAPS